MDLLKMFSAAILVSAITTQLVWAQSDSQRKLQHITAYTPNEITPLYIVPDGSTKPVWEVRWMQALPIDMQKLQLAPPGWLPVSGTKGKAARGKGPRPDSWIKRSDVVLDEDFRKVVGCWPIKSVTYVGGDYFAKVNFLPNGSAVVEQGGDFPDGEVTPKPQRAHVFMTRNIVAIRGPNYYFTAGYRPAERKLYPEGGPPDAHENWPESPSNQCGPSPNLEQNP
jgi:hypothetical protein